jgi:hypothetical protein
MLAGGDKEGEWQIIMGLWYYPYCPPVGGYFSPLIKVASLSSGKN